MCGLCAYVTLFYEKENEFRICNHHENTSPGGSLLMFLENKKKIYYITVKQPIHYRNDKPFASI
jgi:hypothetical protein